MLGAAPASPAAAATCLPLLPPLPLPPVAILLPGALHTRNGRSLPALNDLGTLLKDEQPGRRAIKRVSEPTEEQAGDWRGVCSVT